MTSTTIVLFAAFFGVTALIVGVVSLLRGNKESELEGRLQVLTGAASAHSATQSEASLLSQPLDNMPNLLEKLMSKFPNLGIYLKQSGLSMTPGKFVGLTAGAGLFGFGACSIAKLHFAISICAAITLGMLPFLYVFFIRKRRLAAFARMLPEALELVSRALRAGHSLAAGIHLVATEMKSPIADEFNRCYEEQNLGVPLEEALADMAERVPNMDLQFFVTAVILQRQTGGDLAEILDKIGRLVRERFKIWGAIAALTGEGRLSGIILLALPPALFGVIYRLNKDYVMALFTDPLGKKMLLAAVVMQILGAVVIRKIVNIKV
ncbi:MAG: type II secretion system F family protein [Planctomycetales bacterium]|nr:type II secretion system F family protein [Planctomycetales bacterium]